LDAAPPPPPPPPAEIAPALPRPAATDFYPRDARERELCDKASSPDWLYLAIPTALVAGSIVLDSQVFKGDPNPGVRMIGASLVGVTWGYFVGSWWPAMPKCSPHWVPEAPPEGNVHSDWPIALAVALFAGATAPVAVAIETAGLPDSWDNTERVMRMVLPGVFAFGTALLPYLFAPKTLRAARELEKIRASADSKGAFVSYTLQF
jgi:hypothetical protein